MTKNNKSIGRKLITDIGVLSIVDISKKVISLLFIPLLINSNTIEKYGIYAQLIAVSSLFVFFSTLGLQRSIIYQSQKSEDDASTVFYSLLPVTVLFSLVVSILVHTLSSKMSVYFLGSASFRYAFVVASIVIFSRSIFKLTENSYKAVSRTKASAVADLARRIIVFSSMGISIFFFGYEFKKTLFVFGLSELLTMASFLTGCFFRFGMPEFDFDILRSGVNYGVPLSISAFFANSSARIDRLLLGYFLGPASVGVYDIAYQISSGIVMFSQPVMDGLFPEFSNLLNNGRHKECSSYLSAGIEYFLILAIPAAMGIYIINDDLVRIVANPELAGKTGILVIFISSGMIFHGINRIYSSIVTAAGRTRIEMSINATAAVANVALNALLIKQFGIIGAAYATVMTYAFSATIMQRASDQIVESQVNFSLIGKAIISALIMVYIANYNYNNANMLYDIVTSSFIYFAVLCILESRFRNKVRQSLDILK